jgi:hypothetical protein
MERGILVPRAMEGNMATIIRIESRRKFEKQGLAKMRQALQRGIGNAAENMEAHTWIVEEEGRQQRQGRRHYWWLLGFVMIAVFGAVAGAWPIVKDWISATH